MSLRLTLAGVPRSWGLQRRLRHRRPPPYRSLGLRRLHAVGLGRGPVPSPEYAPEHRPYEPQRELQHHEEHQVVEDVLPVLIGPFQDRQRLAWLEEGRIDQEDRQHRERQYLRQVPRKVFVVVRRHPDRADGRQRDQQDVRERAVPGEERQDKREHREPEERERRKHDQVLGHVHDHAQDTPHEPVAGLLVPGEVQPEHVPGCDEPVEPEDEDGVHAHAEDVDRHRP